MKWTPGLKQFLISEFWVLIVLSLSPCWVQSVRRLDSTWGYLFVVLFCWDWRRSGLFLPVKARVFVICLWNFSRFSSCSCTSIHKLFKKHLVEVWGRCSALQYAGTVQHHQGVKLSGSTTKLFHHFAQWHDIESKTGVLWSIQTFSSPVSQTVICFWSIASISESRLLFDFSIFK